MLGVLGASILFQTVRINSEMPPTLFTYAGITFQESQGFFSCRMDNLRASPFFLQYIVESIPDYHNAVIVAKVTSCTTGHPVTKENEDSMVI